MSLVPRLIITPDYVRLSKPGVNVKTALPHQFLLNSDWQSAQPMQAGQTPSIAQNASLAVPFGLTLDHIPFLNFSTVYPETGTAYTGGYVRIRNDTVWMNGIVNTYPQAYTEVHYFPMPPIIGPYNAIPRPRVSDAHNPPQLLLHYADVTPTEVTFTTRFDFPGTSAFIWSAYKMRVAQ